MGVMSMGYQRQLASSSYHPRILSLGAFQRFLEGGWSPHKRNQCPLPFLLKLGSTRRKAYNYAAVCRQRVGHTLLGTKRCWET